MDGSVGRSPHGDSDPDVVDRNEAIEELDRIFTLSLEMLCLAGFDGNFKRLNPAWERILGWTKAELFANPFMEIVHPEDVERTAVEVQKLASGGDTVLFDIRILCKNGTYRWVQWNAAPMGDGKQFYASGRDVDERKRIEFALAAASEAALEAARSKSQFLANMSHEIRTPMNGVIGMVDLLAQTKMDAEQRDFVETIRQSGEHLLTIINDILDFSKIDAGKLTFETFDFDLREVAESTVSMLARRAEMKGIELLCDIEPDVDTALRGDAGRLRQILMNLLDNAVKFTTGGEIVLRVSSKQDSSTTVTLLFEIKDTGIGIDAETQERLFLPFSQADGSTTRKYGGTGLGLAIARQLVTLMQGEIGIKSVPGKGSTFWFTAHFEKQTAATRTHNREILAGLHVLVVDDNATNRDILETQLKGLHMHPVTASGGSEALAILRLAASKGCPFDLAILDMMMPEMDGPMLAHFIKASPEISSTRLIMLSSMGHYLDEEDLIAAGVEQYLVKPVKLSHLCDSMLRVLGKSGRFAATASSEAFSSASHEVPIHGASILLAEDNAINRKVALGLMKKLGYHVEAVGDGNQVMERLKETSYDIILMDCQMPEMDGYEAARRIRITYGDSIYIIAMTAHALIGDREKCVEAGMNDYLTKPVHLKDLKAALDRWEAIKR